MIRKWKSFLSLAKKEFSVKAYFALTLILWVITALRPSFPERELYDAAYRYSYGVIGSWITFYQPKDYGKITLWFNLIHPGLGVSFSPSVIFGDSLLIYVVYILLVFWIHGYPKHHL